jgi:tRNA pseudouridine38-40 synthase
MSEKKNIRLTLAYDGSRYSGWQRQKADFTIQAVLEEKIGMMLEEPVTLLASGRTDAGVHALKQVCNFVTHSTLDPEDIQRGLNSLLPADIFVRRAEYVALDFHSRFSARSKIYEYRLLNRSQPDVFLRSYTWHVGARLRFAEMRDCVEWLRGEHDFTSFRSSGSGNTNPIRRMMRSELHDAEEGLLRFVFEADGFLRHMVRNIVGTVVDAGRSKMDFREFVRIVEAKDRGQAGIKAPPQGLFLREVRY